MNIACLLFDNISETNGTTVRARRIIDILQKYNDITLIYCDEDNKHALYSLPGIKLIPVFHIGRRKRESAYFLIRILAYIRWSFNVFFILANKQWDVIFCAHDWFSFSALYFLSKIKGFKTVFDANTIMSEEGKELGFSWPRVKLEQINEMFVIKHADHVLACSKNIYDHFSHYAKHIDLVPTFIDTDVFKKPVASPRRKENGALMKVGMIGPFTSHVNNYSLDFVYTHLSEFDPRIHFVVIGECKQRIDSEYIQYTGYLASTNDYISQLSCLDAVLLPAIEATLGLCNKIIEPMACGIPVFTTPKGMVGLYWSEPGKDIFVYEANELVSKVNELIFDGERMRRAGENAQKVIEEYYSLRKYKELIIHIASNLVLAP